ncbi:hypothetical protein [Hyalangium minutum]|uniref:Uncharacterized protein n=1 Tax=Hyalangium minutum TaxID=394096 RepID=A0A085WL82_9BACT|nr:hypothetical protein [Hyalangium minutum]KFE68445.1 hypothetical protein DB31_7682 [Hyalangium minutum]
MTPDLRALFETTFPIASHYFALHWVPDDPWRPEDAHPDDVYAVLRLVTFYLDESGEVSIRDVKEQGMLVVPAQHRQDPRLEAWLRGSREALLEVMQSQDWTIDRDDDEAQSADNSLVCMMPSDLVCHDVLKLARPRESEDFKQALLGSKKRLGHMLFPPRVG